MARRTKTKKKEYLNSTNAQSVANRGLNAAFSQSNGWLRKNEQTGKWEEGGAYTSSKHGRMSTDGKRAGGSTWTFTPKNDDGSAVLKKDGTARQSGRSQIATRRQRLYDVKAGLNRVVGENARAALGIAAGSRGLGLTIG
jgi:hypothetical protein